MLCKIIPDNEEQPPDCQSTFAELDSDIPQHADDHCAQLVQETSDEMVWPEVIIDVPIEDVEDPNDLHNSDDLPRIDDSKHYSNLHLKLLYFCILFHLPDRAIEYMLSVLADENLDIPRTLYLFMKPHDHLRSKICVIQSTLSCGGSLAYLSILQNIQYCLRSHLISFTKKYVDLSIKINIDGLPLFKSSPVTLWPILFAIDGFSFKRPLPICMYTGVGKPNFVEFIQQLCDELLHFKEHVPIGEFFVKISQVIFICDAPARSFCQAVKGHSGYNCCPQCRIPGVYHYTTDKKRGKVIFPFDGTHHAFRTDESYLSQQENNQLSLSPLVHVLSLRDSFPPEYMHSVCLGIVKRFILSFMTNNYGLLECRLSSGLKLSLEERTKKFSNALPKEFQRRIRSFGQCMQFKATEFRSVLFYTFPFLFKNLLATKFYDHFLLLHFAMHIYASPDYAHMLDNAKFCIEQFLLKLSELYGFESCTFNSHSLLHMHEFVRRLGPLDCFSAFKFESYLGLLKSRIKSGRFVAAQSLNSVIEIRDLYVQNCGDSFFFSEHYPNNCAVVEHGSSDCIIIVDYVDKVSGTLSGFKLNFLKDMYKYPYPSSCLCIGQYVKSTCYIRNVSYKNKCVLFIKKGIYFVIPFVNPHLSF